MRQRSDAEYSRLTLIAGGIGAALLLLVVTAPILASATETPDAIDEEMPDTLDNAVPGVLTPADADPALVAEIRLRLDAKHPDARAIEVSAVQGAVTLAGMVQSEELKALAQEIVHDVSGVTSVTNDIRIASEPPVG